MAGLQRHAKFETRAATARLVSQLRAYWRQIRQGRFSLLLLLPFLLFVACSDNNSSSGVSFSEEFLTCYEGYVDLHGDIKTAFQADQKITSKAEYGQKHYEGLGAAEGRELPKSCHAYVDNRDSCWLAYVNKYPDLLDNFAINYPIQTDEQKIKFAKTHYSVFGATEQRTFPNGCSNVWSPPPKPKPKPKPKPIPEIIATPVATPVEEAVEVEALGTISVKVSRK